MRWVLAIAAVLVILGVIAKLYVQHKREAERDAWMRRPPIQLGN